MTMTSTRFFQKKKPEPYLTGKSCLTALAVVMFAVMPLTGCTGSPPASAQKPKLTYDYMTPLQLDVVEVQVIESYRPPFRAPNVDHLFPNQPRKALKEMFRNRLAPAGSTNTMRVFIEEASVVEEPVDEIVSGVQGIFTRETDLRYRATVRINIEILSPDGIRIGGIPLRGERTHEALEGLTVNQREKLWLSMTEKLVQDINRAMTETLKTQMPGFLVDRGAAAQPVPPA